MTITLIAIGVVVFLLWSIIGGTGRKRRVEKLRLEVLEKSLRLQNHYLDRIAEQQTQSETQRLEELYRQSERPEN